MADKDNIFETSTLKYEGIFSFNKLYKNCWAYIMDEIDPVEYSEPGYSEKSPSSGKLIDIEWKFRKKFSDYLAFDGKVTFKTINMNKVNIDVKGKKVSMDKGIVLVKVTGWLVHDYQNKFEGSSFQKKLRNIYDKWIIGSRIDGFEEKVVDFCEGLLKVAKDSLELEGER